MTYAAETGATNRLHFLAPAFGAGFSYSVRLEWKFLALKMNMVESYVSDE